MCEKGRLLSKKLGTNRICMIYDRKDHKKMKYDPYALKKAREIGAELEDYYPMQCQDIYVLHTNWFFRLLWGLIRNFLSSYIRKTVHMISYKKLLTKFDKDCLLKEHGGTSTVNYEKPHVPDYQFFYPDGKKTM